MVTAATQLALLGLVGKMYSKIQSWGSEWKEPQRDKGHKDRAILYKLNLSHKELRESPIFFAICYADC